jgi:hypothetical protein
MKLQTEGSSRKESRGASAGLRAFDSDFPSALRRLGQRFSPGRAGAAVTAFAVVWFCLGFIGSAIDEAAADACLTLGTPHAIPLSAVMRHLAWVAAANFFLGMGILALSGWVTTRGGQQRSVAFAPLPSGLVH